MSGRKKGYEHSSDTRKKMSVSHKGKTKTSEHRMKISLALRGEKSRTWKGGVSSINEIIRKSCEYKLWREAVFRRDRWTCIWCGNKKEINADHIKSFMDYPELRFAIDNGRTLCVPCHKTVHSNKKN